MSKEFEGKNWFVRFVENNKVLKWAGMGTTGLSLLEIYAMGGLIRVEDRAPIIVVGLLGIIAAATGEVSNNAEKTNPKI